MTSILVVEDEPRISSFVSKGLKAAGFVPIVVDSGQAAVPVAVHGDVGLVVLDIGLPDIDGFEVLRRIRAQGGTVPVVVLTARDSAEDTIAGLEGGADDYMAKPFRFEELLARIRLRLRDARPEPATVMESGGVSLDLFSRQVRVDGKVIDLSAREFTLLETFLRHRGRVLSREQLLSHVWGMDFDPGSNVVDVYVGYLRRKLGSRSITTVRGMGYRFEG